MFVTFMIHKIISKKYLQLFNCWACPWAGESAWSQKSIVASCRHPGCTSLATVSKLTSVYEQVNLSKNVVQGQTFQSLEFKDFYGAGAKEKLAGKKENS